MRALGSRLPIDKAAKTLAVMAGGDLVLVVIPAVTSLDLVALGPLLRAPEVRLCSRAELAQLAGELGSLCPLPVGRAAAGVDHEVDRNPWVLCGSGRRDRSLELSGPDLVRLSGASVQRIATPRPHWRAGEVL